MFENRGTNWNFPSWEQEQEMKRMAEIQARALKEQMDKARYEAKCAEDKAAHGKGGGLNYINAYVQKAVKDAPNYAEKREATLHKAQELDAKGGTVNGIMSALLKAICK